MNGWEGRISASLVWDGGEEVRIPEAMGSPRSDQMQGTWAERLSELAGRVCYDSLGKGRGSADYHDHIAQVKHLSTLEHATFTVRVDTVDPGKWIWRMVNHPGVWIDQDQMGEFRITLNLRAALEWNRRFSFDPMGLEIFRAANTLAPMIAKRGLKVTDQEGLSKIRSVALVEPESDEEKWVTLYMTGSRGWSHELVRHGDWTAISQRSTRYVDESESEWVLHPLISAFLEEKKDAWSSSDVNDPRFFMTHTWGSAVSSYRKIVEQLEPWLVSRGVDKISARKQARGAARGVLGNALETEVIFSASVAQWKHMLDMRAADAADAEIRLGFAESVLPALKSCRYGESFAGMELVPASDGIGRSLSGGGHK